MTRVALYVRCSTEEQATEGLSIEGQRSVLHAYCKVKGLEIVEEFVDEGRSGRLAGRHEFQRMIATAKGRQRPWDAILVISGCSQPTSSAVRRPHRNRAPRR